MRFAQLGTFAVLWAIQACGYRPVAGAASERLCVLGRSPRVPDLGAVAAALHGARAELARAGALGSDGRHPCMVVEITRISETATGISRQAAGAGELPRARGTAVAVLGRAWVEESGPEQEPSRETGDMQRAARAAVEDSVSADSARHGAAAAVAGEQLGRALARAILGLPVPREELP